MPAGRRELQARVGELGGPTAHNNYPWGWTMAGNTPFKRWKREVHEGGVADPCIVRWPRGHRRRAARSVTSSRTRSTCCRPCSSSSASTPPTSSTASSRRRSRARASPTCLDDAAAPAAARHPVLRDARQPGDLPRRLEGRDVQAAGPDVRRRPTTPTCRSTRTAGSCTTSPTTSRSATTSPSASRSGSPELIERWWEEARAPPGAAARQPAARGAAEPAPDPPARPDALRPPPDGRAGARSRWRRTSATARTSCGPSSTWPAGLRRRRRPARAGFGARRLDALSARRPPRYEHNLVGKERHRVIVRRRRARGRAHRRLRVRAHRRLRRDRAPVRRRRAGRRGRDPALHAGPVLDHRLRAHVRVRGGPGRVGRLRRAVRVQRGASAASRST